MTQKLNPYCERFTKKRKMSYSIFIAAVFGVLFMFSCSKNVFYDESIGNPFKTDFADIMPSNLADSIVVDPIVSVTFKEGTDPQIISSSSITLKNGEVIIPGTVSISGTTAQFKATGDLNSDSEYEATIETKSNSGNYSTKEYSWRFKTGRRHSYNSLKVVSVSPLSNAIDVPVDSALIVTFNSELTETMKNVTIITLNKGTTAVGGTFSFSGNTARFKPAAPLAAKTIYKGTVQIGPDMNVTGENLNKFTWSFTTAGVAADVTAPVIASVFPANNSTAVAVSSKPTITFSEAMNPSTINTATISLKQGTTNIAGTLTLSGAVATFTPAVALAANTLYNGTVTTAAKDIAGNALVSNYTWSFTTAASVDITAPAILSVVPANSATAIAVSSKAAATFSESMDATTITSSTFTLKQGTTTVAGSVTYSGTTATFAPSASLMGNTVYTATITTGVKDAAGNALASSYTWSFTTVAVVTGKSFATDVMPILNICNTCHKHGWTPSATASVFYTNLVNAGYVVPTTPTSSKIYVKLSGGHPGSTVTTAQVNTILTWITEGAKNN